MAPQRNIKEGTLRPTASWNRRWPARRGLTLLECVGAVVMLAVVTAGIFSAVGFVLNSASREQERLGAVELANRLVLLYLDDSTSMPSPTLPLDYEQFQYRWTIEEGPIRLHDAVPAKAPEGGSGSQPIQSPITLERLKQVSVRVTLSRGPGVASWAGFTPPEATLTRVLDPLTIRNPDAFSNQINTPEGIRRLLELMSGMGSRSVGGASSGASGAGAGAQGAAGTKSTGKGGKP